MYNLLYHNGEVFSLKSDGGWIHNKDNRQRRGRVKTNHWQNLLNTFRIYQMVSTETSDTNKPDHQCITSMSIKEFTFLSYTESRKRIPKTHLQPSVVLQDVL